MKVSARNSPSARNSKSPSGSKVTASALKVTVPRAGWLTPTMLSGKPPGSPSFASTSNERAGPSSKIGAGAKKSSPASGAPGSTVAVIEADAVSEPSEIV